MSTLALLVTCLAFFGLGKFGLLHLEYCCFVSLASASFPECLFNHCHGLRRTFPRFAQHLMDTLCGVHREIASGQIHDSKLKDVKIGTSTQLREILYTVSEDMLLVSSTVASRYYNCYTDGSTCPRNYGCPLIVPS
jgi:hypothetical protein